MWKSVYRGNWGRRIDLRYSQERQTWYLRFKFFWHMSEKSKMWKSVNRGNWGCRIDLRCSQGRQTWSWAFIFFWHMSEKLKIWTEKLKIWKSVKRGIWGCRIDLRWSHGRQTSSWAFKFFWHMSEKSKFFEWGYWVRRIDLKYFQKRPKHPNLFPKRKNTDTREKIQLGWKEKGAPFRSGGAKRQIQGDSKR